MINKDFISLDYPTPFAPLRVTVYHFTNNLPTLQLYLMTLFPMLTCFLILGNIKPASFRVWAYHLCFIWSVFFFIWLNTSHSNLSFNVCFSEMYDLILISAFLKYVPQDNFWYSHQIFPCIILTFRVHIYSCIYNKLH